MPPREHHGSHVAGPAVNAAIHRTDFRKQIRMTAPFYLGVSRVSVADITFIVEACSIS
jgi:hypothetical protein